MFPYPIQLLFFTWLFFVPVKETGKVIAVKDGDTIEVLLNGKAQRIRLAHIDCPEKNQPYGTKAKLFTSEKCFGQLVTLAHNRQYDRNKRLIAEVILSNGDTLNRELVKTGLAWHYKKYSADSTYSILEIKARLEKKGLWADREPVAPWLWRKSSR
jgi:micrococcal nuclease